MTGAAEYRGTFYPTIRAAINRKDLKPILANVGLKKARPVELLSKEQLDAWSPRRRGLTDEQKQERAAKVLQRKQERAAKLLGITPEQVKEALKKR